MPSKTERDHLLATYADLRVADVRDGLDTMMMHGDGSMDPAIRPLWRTQAFGIARTCRYMPYEGAVPAMSPEDYWKWVGRYYREVCPYPWVDEIGPGDFIVIDQSGVCAGLMGSNNSLAGVKNGARGYVTNGGVRDTDELILQKIPFWSATCAQTMVQGRLEFDAKDVAVSVGGVRVHPGDVVVADGDGVIVVPRGVALDVARHAHAEHDRDKAGRRQLYKDVGLELDETVGGEEE
ncbi:MAG TPA: RraA family protein [Phycisphaerae bacterium]|nr:RraA family protein [Phycisphaerae bacterium]